MLDDQRPTLTLTHPARGVNPPLDRILIGMYDYGGLDEATFEVIADFPVNSIPAKQNLATKFQSAGQGIWQLQLAAPLRIARGVLTVSVKDRQGNITRIERSFSAGQ